MVKKQSNSTSQLKQVGLSIKGKYERQLYIKDSYETRILHLWSKMYQSISKCYQSIKETSQMVNLLSETTITEREKLQIFSLLFKNPAEKLKIKKKKTLVSHLWAVTRVSINLNPSNLGANFSVDDDLFVEFSWSFFDETSWNTN